MLALRQSLRGFVYLAWLIHKVVGGALRADRLDLAQAGTARQHSDKIETSMRAKQASLTTVEPEDASNFS